MHMPSIIINLIIAIASPVAWLSLLLGDGGERELSARGVQSLKYYTVLSNLFSGAASTIYAAQLVAYGSASAWTLALKLVATSTVMLTLLVTALFLAPTLGVRAMYRSGNFWMHLILPLLAAVDLCLFVSVRTLSPWSALLAMIPTGLYTAWYVYRVLRFGAEKDGKVYDFYEFMRWGPERIPVVAPTMVSSTSVIAGIMYWLSVS